MDELAASGEVMIPPPAKELRWTWLPENHHLLGETVFDADDDVYDLSLNVGLLNWPSVLRTIILHEMTHMRLGPNVNCHGMATRKSKKWSQESARLASLGAPIL